MREYLDRLDEHGFLFEKDGRLCVRQATKKGYIEAEDGDCIDVEYP